MASPKENNSIARLGELHPDLQSFYTGLSSIYTPRITSGKRNFAFTKKGKKSRHASAEAMDIEPDKRVYNYLWNTKEGISLLVKNKIGILDETTAEMLQKTGGTGAHYHIGKDSTLVDKARQRYTELTGEDYIAEDTAQRPRFAAIDYNLPTPQGMEFDSYESEELSGESSSNQSNDRIAQKEEILRNKLLKRQQEAKLVQDLIKSTDIKAGFSLGGQKCPEGYYWNGTDCVPIGIKERVLDKTIKEKDNIPQAASISRTGTSIQEDGGLVKYPNGGEITTQKPQTEAVRTFFNEYINSPLYREKLSNYSKNPDDIIRDRNQELQQITTDYDYEKPTEYFPRERKIKFNEEEFQGKSIDTDVVIAHEMGHGVGSLSPRMVEQSNRNLKLQPFEYEQLMKRMKNVKGGLEEHENRPWELKSDLDALRYQLNRDKIFNSGKDKFDKSHLEKIREKYKDDLLTKRVMEKLSDEDLIWAMNSLAENTSENEYIQKLFQTKGQGYS